MKKTVVIIGGGLSGLSAADRLSDRFKTIIIEKEDFLGGLASSFKIGNKKIPKHYHHVVLHNIFTRRFLKRFNCEMEKWTPVNVVLAVNRKISNIKKIFGLLGFNYLSLSERFRFGFFGLYCLFLMNPNRISKNLDARTWLNKYAGKGVTSKIWANLYGRNKFNINLADISAKQLAFRINEREIYDKFSYPKKGLQKMIDSFEELILLKGGQILKKTQIKKIDLKKKIIYCKSKGKNSSKIKADAIVFTIPVPEMLNIAKTLPKNYQKQMRQVKYCPCVGITFGTEKFLDKRYYWTNFFNERIHTLIQHSVICDKYENKINWCLRYGGSEEDFDLTDAKIKKEYLAVVKKYFPKANITWAKVFREKYAEPVYDKDFPKYKPELKSPINGVYIANTAVTYPKIRNMNTALECGQRVADRIIQDLSLS